MSSPDSAPPTGRVAKLAATLLEGDNPVYAVAHYVAEQDARIAALAAEVGRLGQQMADLHAGYTKEPVL